MDCLIKPTLLALQLLRAQRDGDFLLQQVSLEAMMPYFFAAGHMNYARYITWYLRNVENLPTTAKNDLMEGERRRKMDETDRNKIAEELEKHSHPLNVKSTDLYNIMNGQVAPTKVNVQDTLHIGSTQREKFTALLPGAFHSKIEMKVKTMQEMKKVVIVNGKPIFDIETLFARLLVVGQQRGVEVTDIFQYELSPVPPPLIDEFGCLRKADKTVLVKCLGVPVNSAPACCVACCWDSRRSCLELRC